MRKLTLLAGFIFFGTVAFGQNRKPIVGLEIGPKVTKTRSEQTGMGFGAGVFADLPLYHKLGLSTGLRLMQLNYGESYICNNGFDFCPYEIKRFYALELPIGFNLDLSVRQNANWKFHLKGNYVIARTLATESILVREHDRVKRGIGRYEEPMAYTHGAEFGIELQGFAAKKYMVAIGPSFKVTQLLHGDQNQVTVFGLNLKLGRNFNVK